MMRLVAIGLVLSMAAGIGWRMLTNATNAWATDAHQRAELVRSSGSWEPTPQPGIHYQVAVRVPTSEGAGR